MPAPSLRQMPRIALATYAGAPALTPDDRLLRTALEAAGAEVQPAIWDEPHDWAGFDLIVLRSTWDYFIKADEFAGWIAELQRVGAEVLNPLEVIRWNGDKRYLLALQEQGVGLVPTEFIEHGDHGPGSLADLLESRNWPEAVVKPAISGGAHDTWRTSLGEAATHEADFAAMRKRRNGGVLVQPFMDEILTAGELSLVFLDGVYSHAAVKRPKAGDFRVQQEHGGHYAPCRPSPSLVEQAGQVIDAAAASVGVGSADLLYARVDGVVVRGDAGDRLLLMELECVEPSLFFMQHPPAAARMARSLVERLELHARG